MKLSADKSLSEVRKKVSDADRLLHTLKGLTKLRELRREPAKRRGKCDNFCDPFLLIFDCFHELICLLFTFYYQ